MADDSAPRCGSHGGDPADEDTALVERAADALAGVSLPDGLGDDPFTAGVVTDVRADTGTVTIAVSLDPAGTTGDLDPETADTAVERLRSAVFEVPGVEEVHVEEADAGDDSGPDGTAANDAAAGGEPHGHGEGDHNVHEHPEPAAERTLDGVDHVVAVASAKGGVGKTTVSVALARGLAAAGLDVGLFDADVYGPNVPELLDVEGPVRATEDGAAAPVERAGVETMSVGLLSDGGPLAWRGSMAHEALSELLFDTAWGHTVEGDGDGGERGGDDAALDVLVLDVPPGTGDIPLTITQSVPVDGTVLVSTPAATALSDTARFRDLLDENGVPALGVVRNMDGFTCPTCGDTHDLFDADADPGETLDTAVLASLQFDASLRERLAVDADGDRTTDATGEAELPDAARELASAVGDRLALDDDAPVPEAAVDVRGMPERPRREHVRAEAADTAPGGTLSVVDAAPPDSLLSTVADGFGCAIDRLDPRVRRHDDDRWSLTVERPPAGADPGPDATTADRDGRNSDGGDADRPEVTGP
ncbi:P-loop NTPase [Halobaculum sp. WSA2]|uniref:Iron-sulfur cluster carrier protein n=1 Tax=Halobaculum saliterrae TaxID=2073113 RepID=A0A6B0SRV4_9EURY|nr:P-loop NTPase [Halobaculum saliterrae]MXR40316.1 P-loop NTPase [Halobaculum saliterrae]